MDSSQDRRIKKFKIRNLNIENILYYKYFLYICDYARRISSLHMAV